MKFDFSTPRIDGRLETAWDVLLRIVARFCILVDGKEWYAEEDFCIVELAAALADWLDRLGEGTVEFSYTSLESAEPVLLRFFTPNGGNGWQILSPHESYHEERIFSTVELVLAAESFLGQLRDELPIDRRMLELLADKKSTALLLERLR